MRTTPLPLVGLFAIACTGEDTSKDGSGTPPMDYTAPMPPPMTTPPMTQPPTGITGVTGDTGTQVAPMPYTQETGDTGTGGSGSTPSPTPASAPGLSPLPPGRATSR